MKKDLAKKIFIFFSTMFALDSILLGTTNIMCDDCDKLGYIVATLILSFFWCALWFAIYAAFFCKEGDLRKYPVLIKFLINHIHSSCSTSSLRKSFIVLSMLMCIGIVYLFLFGIHEIIFE